MNILKILAVGVIALSLSACQEGRENEAVGTLLGAVAGAAIGSQIGSGSGQAVAIGVGALVGGLVGNQIGRHLDEQDRQYAEPAAFRAVNDTPTGTTSTWSNPDSQNYGTYRPLEEPYAYKENAEVTCRLVETTYVIDGQTETGQTTMCTNPDGSVVIPEGQT